MKRIEIRFAGFGGQGMVLIGIVLGRAACLYDGLFAVQTQSYGSEAGGGAARSDVIISSEPIDSPVVTALDYLVALSQEALDKNIGALKANGALLIEKHLIRTMPPGCGGKTLGFRAVKEASELFCELIVANMIILGAFVEISRVVTARALEAAVTEAVPKSMVEVNLKALKRGVDLARGMSE